MAARITAAVRQAASISRISTHQASHLVQRRGLAGAVVISMGVVHNRVTAAKAITPLHSHVNATQCEHHGPPKVNCWQDPMNPGKWKEEHFVIVSLSGWGLLLFGGYKFFTKGKKEMVVVASH